MLGNDIVDLLDREARPAGRQPRFDARVFDDAERDSIGCADDPARARWMLWAAKEASYKAAKRLDAEVVFSPRRFRVELGEGGVGRVVHPQGFAQIRFEQLPGAVHAVAIDERVTADVEGSRLIVRWRRTSPEDPSASVRALVREELSPILGVSPDEIRVVRIGRMPELELGREWVPAVLSLSHHGEWVAFACGLAPCSLGSTSTAESAA